LKGLAASFDQYVKESPDFDFPSLQMVAYQNGRRILQMTWGKPYTYFDLASLTKIIFTTLWFMESVERDRTLLSRAVSCILPWYPHKKVRVKQLLTHSAGNEWWQPFYKKMTVGLPPEQVYQQIEAVCRKAPLSSSPKAVYSDIDFYLLGSIMQKIEGQALHLIWQRLHATYYKTSRLHFNVGHQTRFSRKSYAPTEKCPWRQKVIQGEVHDENCWALGGVAPHAGLFGCLQDLALFGKLMRKMWLGQHSKVSKATFRKFTDRALPRGRGDWGLGFMKPSGIGSSAGTLFSKRSFGHTGFTGTSFWFDPTRDLFVGLLSNRVHPSRDNKGFQRLRPLLHDQLVQTLEGTK
jgi:CubicO group peptidase (beta-lactamase class C family)